MRVNLKANNQQEQKILEYLEENVSDILAEKINNGTVYEKDNKHLLNKKTLTDFMEYAYEEAHKLAEKNARSICIDDSIVYGWAIHYFEEDSIIGTLYTENGEEYKPIRKTEKTTQTKQISQQKPQTKKEKLGQQSIFDFLENTAEITETVEITENEPEIEDTQNEDDKIEEKQSQCKTFYQEYKNTEKQYPDHMVIQRLGDFYEVFGEKAIQIANQLELTITSRDCGINERVPLIGFPYHAADNYFKKIRKYMPIVIIENGQVIIRGETNKPKTLMERYEEMCKAYPDFIIAIKNGTPYEIYGANARMLANEYNFTLFQKNNNQGIYCFDNQHIISTITQTHNIAFGSCLEDMKFYTRKQ